MSNLTILIALILFATISGYPTGINPASVDQQLHAIATERFAVHGNWCGPGHSGSTSAAPCIDYLDCVCKEHDLCYRQHGYLNCKCDWNMVTALSDTRDAKAVTMRNFFIRSPCFGPVYFPVTRFCRKCRSIFGRRVCVRRYPCGVSLKCYKGAHAPGKNMISRYNC